MHRHPPYGSRYPLSKVQQQPSTSHVKCMSTSPPHSSPSQMIRSKNEFLTVKLPSPIYRQQLWFQVQVFPSQLWVCNNELLESRLKYKSGLEHYKSRLEYYKSGLKYYKSGLEYYKSGLEYYKSGLEYYKSGLQHYKSGLQHYKFGLEYYKSGLQYYKSGLQYYKSSLEYYKSTCCR